MTGECTTSSSQINLKFHQKNLTEFFHFKIAAAFHIFESVNTVYGPGYVAEIRQSDYVVKLANWALAQGQSPTLYLAAESIR
jgi:hypothetical protein